MEMKNARLYARVSTDEQRKKEQSVPDQLEALKEYCQEHNYTIKGIYHDDGISAATIDKRKDFCRMLDDLQQNEVILFTKLDRFSRDLLDGNLLLKRFAPLNVSFKAILEPDIDVTTADGKFTVSYTHLTLPTINSVSVWAGPGVYNNKKGREMEA